MPRACSHAIRLAAIAWLLALVLGLLSACGGGGDADDDDRKTVNPPDCVSNPEKCK